MIKYISTRIITLILIISVTSIVYEKYFFESDVLKHSDAIHLIRNLDPNTEVLYIGESSNSTAHATDFDKRKISEMTADFYPKLVFDDITKPASHAGIYKTLINKIPEKNQIKTLIVTLNLRSFGWDWVESKLETALNKNMVLLESDFALYNRFRLGFKAYNQKSEQERRQAVLKKWDAKLKIDKPYNSVNKWDKHIYKTGVLDDFGKRDDQKTALTAHFIKNYAFHIDTNNHPRIKDFDEIVEIAKKRNWNVVFNLLAENTERANELVGNDLVNMMVENSNLLKEYYTKKGVLVSDHLNLVADSLYTDRNWPTEHYKEKGRQIIGSHLATSLRQIYPEAYKHHTYLSYDEMISKTNVYENNLETVKGWTNETRTNEQAFSGQYATKVNASHPYGPTLEIPFYKLNVSLKKSVSYSFKALLTDQNKTSEIVIELHQKDKSVVRKVKKISEFNLNNHWQEVSHTFEIEEQFYNSEHFKIYLYNPVESAVYIDDLVIEFGK